MLQSHTVLFSIAVVLYSAPASTVQVHRVNVGNNGFRFDPNTTFAGLGDVVTFVFYPTNHSVNRAPEATEAYSNPCVPYELAHSDQSGFHSGNVRTQSLDPNEVVGLLSSRRRRY